MAGFQDRGREFPYQVPGLLAGGLERRAPPNPPQTSKRGGPPERPVNQPSFIPSMYSMTVLGLKSQRRQSISPYRPGTLRCLALGPAKQPAAAEAGINLSCSNSAVPQPDSCRDRGTRTILNITA